MSHSTWKMDRLQTGEIVMPLGRDGSQCPLALLTTGANHNCEWIHASYLTLSSGIPWYIPHVNCIFSGSVNTQANLFFLGIHPRLKARVWTDKIQVTSGISMVYHSKALNNYFTSFHRKYINQHNEWVGIVEKVRCNSESSDTVHRFNSPSYSRVSLPCLTDLPAFSRGNNLDSEQSLFSLKFLGKNAKQACQRDCD